ncbi:hypothetical protein ACIRSJ_35070 [Streptomyces virginiae]|uniref:PepSY domain-containing protein n=2 Tax=Streptomyces virginiae TaxID=1961 RepID=A0ABQ3NNJ4_STRVG|nr:MULTISPECIES: hypothetical protein [Streptomyces]KOU14398.1 hypothetical protein ADK49_22955 [Streptomyces sp. WM6349]KOU77239.1 hypothetical protein ADK94_36790 [Streptomyces sp. XY593]KOU98937.1 hypothetical protein ADK91_28850 [Streptomyces sp. XY511]KOV08533.1 hypothetical protein ADK92_03295 [Streptomyces sp. XY533]KOV41189.1 hypothetical protein ADK98_27215 [Streptomyces sp. H036]
MSESAVPPPPEQPPGNAPEAGARKRVVLSRLVPRGRRARWVAAGAVVVVVGGGVAAVAAAEHHHHERADRAPHMLRFDSDHGGGLKRGPQGGAPDDERARKAPGGEDGPEARKRFGHPEAPGLPGAPGRFEGREGHGGYGKGAQAPAPLPSLSIGDAAAKAAAAVAGGKVESLRPVAQDGGGSAWLAVVLGPDGVRHAVTVSGTDGTITGNTALGG